MQVRPLQDLVATVQDIWQAYRRLRSPSLLCLSLRHPLRLSSRPGDVPTKCSVDAEVDSVCQLEESDVDYHRTGVKDETRLQVHLAKKRIGDCGRRIGQNVLVS